MVPLQNFEWTKLDINGTIPESGSGQETVLINNKLYLFGGCVNNEKTRFRDGLYEFDLDTHKWSKIISKNEGPSRRTCFCMCKGYYDNTLIVMGGAIEKNDTPYVSATQFASLTNIGERSELRQERVESNKTELTTDLYEFNIRTKLWTKLFDEMPPYYGQSINLYGSLLLIFGGTKGVIYTNDLYSYDFITNTITKIETLGEPPKPLYKHQSIIVKNLTPDFYFKTEVSYNKHFNFSDNNDYLYVIGGGSYLPIKSYISLYALNLNTFIWKKINSKGLIPHNRIAHSCSYNSDTKEIYLFGGLNTKLDRLNDFYILNTVTSTWKRFNKIIKPEVRGFSSSIFYNGGFYIGFGADSEKIYNDIWKFQITNSVPNLSILCSNIIKQNKKLYKQTPLYLKNYIDNINNYSTK
jgi:N-acetylneuraminic acid mutarotase